MKIYFDKPLSQFEFWSGAKDRADLLTIQELDRIGDILEEMYGEMEDVEINDMFWFDFDNVCKLIGLTEEEVFERSEDND